MQHIKTALITGVTGQDGAYLAKLLLEKGYQVYGTYRRVSTPNFWRLGHLDVLNKIKLIPADVYDMSSLLEAVVMSDPKEIYNLAAQSYVGASFDQPLYTSEIDGITPIRFLEIIRHLKKDIKFYQASTSELYGNKASWPQSETTPFNPSSPYAAAKLFAFHATKTYRESYNLFACNGILFNHESPLRGLEFVTRKISNAVAKIKLGLQKEISLGNTEAKRDWGFAPEYVEAMWRILQHDIADDFVVATGETHSVQEFAEHAFNSVGLNWQDYVKVDDIYKRPNDVNLLFGDPSKIRNILGWQANVKFKELVKVMVDEDLKRWQKYMNGERFHWDAHNYPHDINIIKRNINKENQPFG